MGRKFDSSYGVRKTRSSQRDEQNANKSIYGGEKREGFGRYYPDGLTFLERAFVDAFCGSAKETEEILLKAGIKIHKGYGYQLLSKEPVQIALKKRNSDYPERSELIAAKEERRLFWTQVMFDPDVDIQQRLKASEILGRCDGDFVDKTMNIQASHDDFVKQLAAEELSKRIENLDIFK